MILVINWVKKYFKKLLRYTLIYILSYLKCHCIFSASLNQNYRFHHYISLGGPKRVGLMMSNDALELLPGLDVRDASGALGCGSPAIS